MDVLPDDILLRIFDLYINDYPPDGGDKTAMEAWQSLVHVCGRWRSLVLGSPHHLNVRIYCTPETRTRDALDVWPALPLQIKCLIGPSLGMDNIIAALGQSNRVCEVNLYGHIADRQLDEVLAAMQVPFPELRELTLIPINNIRSALSVPDSFLGGSAPRLQHFSLASIAFPGLPKLLSSANRLVTLWLTNIPHSGYISPEAIVGLLSVMSSLRTLCLQFQSPQSRPGFESRTLPSPNRIILPALNEFRFTGVAEYLEELVTRIDTPQLDHTDITFLHQINFNCPRLAQFINRTPTLRGHDKAHVNFNEWWATVTLLAQPRTRAIGISCRELDRRLSSIAQVCNFSLHPLSTVDVLYIEHQGVLQRFWRIDATENTLWLQLLLPFTAVVNLYLSKEFAPSIALALQEPVGGRITEVLPSLQNIFVEGLEPSGPFQIAIGQFVAARQLSDHPIAISVWDK